MTMNISTLPMLPRAEAAHTKRNEAGAAEFDVKTLLKNKMQVMTPEPVETAIEEKPQANADEEASPDNADTSPVDLQQLLNPIHVQLAVNLKPDSSPASARTLPASVLAWNSTPAASVKGQTALPAPQEQLPHTGGAKPVEQVTAKAEVKVVTGNSPSIADALPKMQQVNQVAAASLSGSVPQPRSIPVQSVTSISGQFAQSVKILPSSGPVTPAQGKIEASVLREGSVPSEVSNLRDAAVPKDTHPDTAVKVANSLDRSAAKVTNSLDRTADKVTNSLDRTADKVANSLDRTADKVPNNLDRSADKVANSLDRADDKILNNLDRPAAKVPNSLDRSTDKIPNSLDRATDKVPNNLDRSADRVPNSLDRAKVSGIGDRLNAQQLTPQFSGGNVQTAGTEFTAVFETPAHQIIDAIEDEVSAVTARLKAQAALAVETSASGKLPLLSQIKVDLNPGSLGAVRIELAMSTSGEVDVNVLAAKETTALMIERGREEVLGGLQSRNVEVRGLNINTAETGSGTQAGSQQEGSAARFSGHGEGQQSRHVPNGRGGGQANGTGPEHSTSDEEMLQQAVRNSGSGIYI